MYVDQIEEGRALLILEENSSASASKDPSVIRLPASLLPTDAREGQWLEIHIRTAQGPGRSLLREQLNKDDGKDISL